MLTAVAMLTALILDASIGWPQAIYRRIGHPVTWIGALIARLDHRYNLDTALGATRRRAGAVCALLVIGLTAAAALVLAVLLPNSLFGAILTGVLAWPLVAARSLHDHVADVARPLAAEDLAHAREAVAMIVGRDPATLDQAGVARAALESLGENASDGVIAPLFWGLLLGLPGIAAYKAINTLDSMIGYRTPRHADFGRFAARLDDVANWIPARLTGWMLAAVSGSVGHVAGVMRRDARNHRSPNAGWPEAAMAAAVGCRLSGPRSYDTRTEDHPWLNGAAPDPTDAHLFAGLALFERLGILAGALLAALALI